MIMSNQPKIEKIMLDDGRRAERHTSVDDQGNEIVEIFAEEKHPLKLEKRIMREFKSVIAKETHETIRDGQVSYQEVKSLEPEVPLQIRSRVSIENPSKKANEEYVKKEDVSKMITEGVIAGIATLIDQKPKQEPLFKPQTILENKVEGKKKNDMTIMIIMALIFIAQVAAIAYFFVL